jgi:hypothetical protein
MISMTSIWHSLFFPDLWTIIGGMAAAAALVMGSKTTETRISTEASEQSGNQRDRAGQKHAR